MKLNGTYQQGTIQDVDTLLVISDGTSRVFACKRIYELIQTLPFDVGEAYLVAESTLLQEDSASGLKLFGCCSL